MIMQELELPPMMVSSHKKKTIMMNHCLNFCYHRTYYRRFTLGASNEKTIGRLVIATRKWSSAGSLVTARRGHNPVYDGLNVLVVGGYPGGSNFNSLKT